MKLSPYSVHLLHLHRAQSITLKEELEENLKQQQEFFFLSRGDFIDPVNHVRSGVVG